MSVSNCANNFVPPAYRPVTDERFKWLETFVTPGQVVNVYEFPSRDGFGGTFDTDHLNDLAVQAAGAGPDRELVFTLNPTAPSGNRNRLVPTDDEGPKVLARRWLPIRLFGGKATADELNRVEAAVRADLAGFGWADPVVVRADGRCELYYLVDLPAEDGGRCFDVLVGLGDRHGTDGVWIDDGADEPDESADLFGSPGVGDVVVEVPADLRTVPGDRLQAAARVADADWEGEVCVGPAFEGEPRKVTPRETLQDLRHGLRLLPSAGPERLTDRPHEVACRLLAEKGLHFGEAMPILVEWDHRQAVPVGIDELEAELINAMNAAREEAPGLTSGRIS